MTNIEYVIHIKIIFLDNGADKITGATGTGKSYLAQALGNCACMMQYKTMYNNFARLIDQVKLSKLEGTYLKLRNKIEKADLGL